MAGAFTGDPHIRGNRKDLREVRTVYDVAELNNAIEEGSICLVKQKELNNDLKTFALLLRNRATGEYVVAPGRTVYTRKAPLTYSEAEWELVQTVEGYARRIRNESNWGAYVLPGDAKLGERFFISELIEDFVASKFWYTVRAAETAEATWDGSELVIDHTSYRLVMIG